MRKELQRSRSDRRRGSAMIEFTLAGVLSVALTIMTLHLSLAMWSYHTLANAVRMGAELASVKGKGCYGNGNACGATVGDIAQRISQEAPGIPPGAVNVTLTTASGAVTNCSPLSNCASDTTPWPPDTNHDNVPGASVTVAANYPFPFPLFLIWPGTANMSQINSLTLPASSTQRIVF